MSHSDKPETEGREAVCFTAGVKGGFFGAGVVHAYLASDRKPPKVAAGISFGAVTAAAFQRVYAELEQARTANPGNDAEIESGRWTWFRRYLTELCNPFDPIWRAFPDPVDFFADTPPVEDLSCPSELKGFEQEARRQYHLLVHAGRWLAALRVRISSVAEAIVAHVRFKEGYKTPAIQYAKGKWYQLRIVLGTLLDALRPRFVEQVAPKLWITQWRPLLGWPVWLLCALASASFVLTLLAVAHFAARYTPGIAGSKLLAVLSWTPLLVTYGLGLVSLGVLLLTLIIPPARRRLIRWTIRAVGRALKVDCGLLHDYQLRRKLWDVFAGADVPEPKLGNIPFPVVLVSSALQSIRPRGTASNQVWAPVGWPLVDALRAALLLPWIYSPLQITEAADIRRWVGRSTGLPDVLQIVDGTVIRKNPLPALFSFLRRDPELVRALMGPQVGGHPARSAHTVKLVYSVPLDGRNDDPMKRPNIVEAAFTSMELASRRDSRLEQIQTNLLSGLAKAVPYDPKVHRPVVPLFVEAIAPDADLVIEDPLAPRADQVLTIVAAGCRRTLQTLYANQIERMANGQRAVGCADLLKQIAPRRTSVGLPEVCARCTRCFETGGSKDRIWSHSMAAELSKDEVDHAAKLVEAFPRLAQPEPRLVFVASGGVFRGSFHAGVIGALHATGIRPDMVVGSSVGAMIGGCLAAVSVSQPDAARRLVVELATCFLRVDREIALTRTVKNAAKQIGVRGRHVRLSPHDLRTMIRKGTRSDPGYAALGAPPALLDAISELLILPHNRTREIAAEFVAAHFTLATRGLWEAVQVETLRRLNIENSVVGTSLMELVAKRLLGARAGINLNQQQPFRNGNGQVAFFATATSLNRREGVLLGWDVFKSGPFDAVEACLASGAFPALFSARPECLVEPGTGRPEHFLADGGMFDNLPFYRAADVLSLCWSASKRTFDQQELKRRIATPDLFLAGALDPDPKPTDSRAVFPDVKSAGVRAKQMRNNLKIDTFQFATELAEIRLKDLDASWHAIATDHEYLEFVGRYVHAAVLKIAPTDKEHLNPTFAFCRSMGLKEKRVASSIADGCFRTIRGFVEAKDKTDTAGRSVAWFVKNGRIPSLSVRPETAWVSHGECPYFLVNAMPLSCPFARPAGESDATTVYEVCRWDPMYRTSLVALAQQASS